MILADTSIWIDHLRRENEMMTSALNSAGVLMHPFVAGELIVGNLPDRVTTLASLRDLPPATVASHAEVLALIERERLFGHGVGFTDLHLMASAMLTKETALWTRDRRLSKVAQPYVTVLDA